LTKALHSHPPQEIKHTVTEGEQGLYSLVFVRCNPPQGSVDFKIHAKFYNPGPFDRPNYLSAGEAALPTLYFGFFVLYGIAMGVWLYVLRKDRDHVSPPTPPPLLVMPMHLWFALGPL
jgi:hypothetical protein